MNKSMVEDYREIRNTIIRKLPNKPFIKMP